MSAHGPFQARFPAAENATETWRGLHGSSLAIALRAAAAAVDRATLVVTRSSHQAQSLFRDLELLATQALPVLLFPDHETLPYDPFSPHPDIIANRLATLAGLPSMGRGILLTPISALLQRLPPAAYITQRSFNIATGDQLVIDAFRRRLEHAGYEAAEQVYQAGQFAVRGSVVDLYPAGSATPYRLDLFDEEVESIREFDPESQRSTGRIDRIDLLPAREYPCDESGLDAFRRAFRNRFDVDTRHVNLYQDLRAGVHPQGLEQYLPLFYGETSCLLDYLDKDPHLVMQDGVEEAARDLSRRTHERWEQRRHDVERPILEPGELFFTPEGIADRLDALPRTDLPSAEAPAPRTPVFETR